MKRNNIHIIGFIVTLLLATGCTDNNSANNHETKGFSGEPLGYRQPNEHYTINRKSNTEIDQFSRFGFGRDTKESAEREQQDGEIPHYDRALLADAISQTAALLPEIDEAAALVTDQYVLLAYDSDLVGIGGKRNELATQMKKTAFSFVP